MLTFHLFKNVQKKGVAIGSEPNYYSLYCPSWHRSVKT